jgi:transposase
MMNDVTLDYQNRRIRELEEELMKERKEKEKFKEELRNEHKKNKKLKEENKDLKEQLARLKGSAPVLGASDKTSEAGGVPSSKTFYKRDRCEGEGKKTGGQPGHKGHGRKRPKPNAPPVPIILDECPICGKKVGAPVEGAEQRRTITDIPLPSHLIYEIIYHRYWCGDCKKMVRGEALWIPPFQHFGPAVASWIAYHRMLGLTVCKICSSLYETYNIEISEATVLKLEKWVADTLQEDYKSLKEELVKASSVNADETRFRIGGKNGWLWVFAHTLGSYYEVAPTRSHVVPEEVLEGFEGVLGRDAWKPYDVVKCAGHQLDLLHVNRWFERAEIRHRVEPRTILSSKPAKLTKPGRPPKKFLEFVDGARSILKRSIEYSKKEPPSSIDEHMKAAEIFREEMLELLDREWNDKDVVRISKEMRKRLNMLFTFLEKEGVPWHNNDAERAIRKGVLARKISGGRRTWDGANTFQILLSVYETSKKKGKNFIELVNSRLGMSLDMGGDGDASTS